MFKWQKWLFVFVLLLFSLDASAVGVTLSGSPASMQHQNSVAKDLGYTFIQTPEQVGEMVEADELVPVRGNAHYDVLESVSYKVARPEMRMFIERLAEQYHEGTGEQLVVTSLTRPSSEQPRNSHPLSVHPTGMAVDLRVSSSHRSRVWLESVLLKLERQGVLDITRERYPPHYHIALFPRAYTDYVGSMIGPEALAASLIFPAYEPEPEPEEQAPLQARAATIQDTESQERLSSETATPSAWKILAVVPWLVIPAALFWRRRRSA